MNPSKTPSVRFKGYEDEWEDRKLSSIAERVTRKNKNNESTLPLTISAQDGLVDQNDYFNKQVASRDVTGYFLVKNGEFAYNKSYSNGYPWGAIKRLDNYEMGVLSTLYIVFKPTAINSQFLVSYYETTRWYREVSKNAAEGARNHGLLNISPNDFFNTLLTIPKSAEEQQKIGSFFKQLDDTIALHQRKLNLLNEQKKGFLQKMFPKNGEKIPEIRFVGFNDDWEERKLGDHAKYRRGSFPQPYGNKEWYDGEGAMPFVQVVDVTNKLTLVENTKQKISKLAQSKSVFVPKGKVVVTLQGSIGRVAITQYDSFVDRTLLIFEDYEKETDERFWAYTIQKKFEIEKLKAPGGTIKTITKEALSSFDVHLPKFEEQQKIGSFFKKLDDTIALHQRKIDELKSMKKSMLQKMFV